MRSSQAMAPIRPGLAVALAAAATLSAGCGSGATNTAASQSTQPRPASSTGGGTHGAAPGSSSGQTIPTPGPTGRRANPAAVTVVRAWSSALQRGDVEAAARYFALPSEFINGPDASGRVPIIRIRSLADAAAINTSLPCGASFVSADQRGAYVNVLFRLTDRPGPGGGCGSGIGQKARTNFVIRGGRIVEWIRAPDDPGDNPEPTVPTPPPAAPAPPATPQPTAPPSDQATGPAI
jgi:hypothetical protein